MGSMIRFEPALYSYEELRFLKEHIGKPPVVALAQPIGKANPKAVSEVLQTVYDLEQLKEHRGQSWVGIDAIKKSIDTYLSSAERDLEMWKRGAPRYSSMHTWDAKGRPHKLGTGSDSDIVRTVIDENGARRELGVDLRPTSPTNRSNFTAPWAEKKSAVLPNDLIEDEEKGFIQCPLCGFAQNYNTASDQSRNMARARVGKHMQSITGAGAEEHKELYTHIFG